MVSQEMIDQVLKLTNITELIGGYLPLQQVGNGHRGLCPFHNEKTPSFSVSADKGIFECFVCGKGGNAIKFLMLKERLNFPEAYHRLAVLAGLLESEIHPGLLGTVYVLVLEEGKYNIGFTANFDKRIEDHFQGKGAVQTKKYPPVKLIESFKDVAFEMENEQRQKYMNQYGWSNVRGGGYVFRYLKYQETPADIHRMKKDGTYLLQLEQGKYFVGFSQDMDSDISRQFNGTGLEWTKRCPLQSLIKD